MLCDDACIAQGSQRASVPTPRAAAVSAPEKQFFGTSVRTAYALQRTRLGFPPRAAAAHASPAPPAATNKSDAKGGKRAASQAANSSSGGGAPSEKTVTAFVYRLSDACSAGPSKEQAKRFGLVLAEAREQSIDPSALIARTMGLLKGGNKARAMRVLAARAAEVEEPLTTAAYQQLVEGAVLGKDSKSAAHWLEELAFRGGLVPRIPTVNAVVDLMMRRGEAAAAAGLLERLWDKGLKRDPSTFETMATACVARGWPEEALACAREMIAASAALEARNPRRAPVRANKVLRLLVGAGARKEAAALFADMRAPSCHFKPDAATYDAMARDAVAAREFGTAVGHAAQARAEGIDFGAFRLNAIVKELIAGGDLEGAGALVSAMAAWPEVGTTGVTWIQYINALVVAGKLEEAAEAFAKARPKLLAPSDAAELASLYNIAVKGAAAGRMFNRVRGLVEEMRGDGVRPDAATYGLWMDALVAEGRLSEAISVFDEARRALPEGTPMSGIWNIVLKGFLALGQVDDGRRWLATMRAEGVAPDVRSFASVAAALAAAGRVPEARLVIDEAAAAGAADRRLYASFLTTLVRGRSFGAAWELLEALERPDSAVGPDAGMYHTMLVSLCAARRLKPARELFYRAAGRGVLLDRASHAALARALRKAGQADEAAEWEERAKTAPEPEPRGRPGARGRPQPRPQAQATGRNPKAPPSPSSPRPPRARRPSASPAARSRKNSGPRPAAAAAAPKA